MAKRSTPASSSKPDKLAILISTISTIVCAILIIMLKHDVDTTIRDMIVESDNVINERIYYGNLRLSHAIQSVQWDVQKIANGDIEIKVAQIQRPTVYIKSDMASGALTGTGVCLSVKGGYSYIITAAHVVLDATAITITHDFRTGPSWPGELLVASASQDVALVRIKAELPYTAQLLLEEDGDSLTSMAPCYTYGYALGLYPGHFSGGYICDATSGRMSASVAFGNSGGGVFIRIRPGEYRLVGVVSKIDLVRFNGIAIPVFHMAHFSGPQSIRTMLKVGDILGE